MTLRTKSELLAHYAAFEVPNKFIQFDGFDWPGDCLASPDTGLALFRGVTHELMNGADVRVLVRPGADPERVLQILREVIGWIERSGVDQEARALEIATTTRQQQQKQRTDEAAKQIIAGQLYGTRRDCFICGKALDDSESIARGIGMECWQRVLESISHQLSPFPF